MMLREIATAEHKCLACKGTGISGGKAARASGPQNLSGAVREV
jgi:hypothetical protein